jgi:hypothetical protein
VRISDGHRSAFILVVVVVAVVVVMVLVVRDDVAAVAVVAVVAVVVVRRLQNLEQNPPWPRCICWHSLLKPLGRLKIFLF